MRRSLNVVFFMFLVGLLAAGALILSQKPAADQIKKALETAAAQNGARLTITKSILRAPKLSLLGVNAYIPVGNAVGFLQIDALDLTVNLKELLSRKSLVVDVSGNAYGGLISGRLIINRTEHSVAGNLQLTGAQISRQIQLAALGISSGQLDVSLPTFTLKGDSTTASLELNVKDVSRPAASLSSQALPVSIPDITGLSFDCSCALSNVLTNCGTIQSISSLGSFSGNASIQNGKRPELSTVNAAFEVALSSEGLQFLGPWLPVISNGQLTPEQGLFKIMVKGSAALPQVAVSSL